MNPMASRSRWLPGFALAAAALLALVLAIFGGPAGVSEGASCQAPPPTPLSVTLYAIEDSFVDDGMASTNYGGSASLYTSFYGEFLNRQRFLAKFDLSSIPTGSAIESASFRAYLNYSSGRSPVDLTLCQIAGSWSEYTVTWNNSPVWVSWTSASVGSSTGLYSWDATGLVSAWKAGLYPNYDRTSSATMRRLSPTSTGPTT